jgi:hypothetical protein
MGEGVTPIYFISNPGLDVPEFGERAAAWFTPVRRCQRFDLRARFRAVLNFQVSGTPQQFHNNMGRPNPL